MIRLRNVTLVALLIVLVAVATLAASPGGEATPPSPPTRSGWMLNRMRRTMT